jgi:hypothetical protein
LVRRWCRWRKGVKVGEAVDAAMGNVVLVSAPAAFEGVEGVGRLMRLLDSSCGGSSSRATRCRCSLSQWPHDKKKKKR